MQTRTDNFLLLLAAALLALLCSQVAAAEAPAGGRPRFFDIPAQPLETALLAYAEQAGFQILFRADLLQGHRSPGIKGLYEPTAAIRALLATTGFEFQMAGDRTLIIGVAAAAPSRTAP